MSVPPAGGFVRRSEFLLVSVDGVASVCEHMFLLTKRGERMEADMLDRDVLGAWLSVHVPVAVPDAWSCGRIPAGLRVLEDIRRQVDAAVAVLVAGLPDDRDLVAGVGCRPGKLVVGVR
jgi:hypothetical protein